MHTPKHPQGVTAIILAGGQGRRVGGEDKGWLLWRERPLIHSVLEAARAQSDSVIISCNRNQARYAALGVTTVADTRENFQGPLAGLEAALECCETPLALVLPCDCPQVSKDLLAQLKIAKDENLASIAYAKDSQRDHYLFALMDCALLPALQAFLNEGGRAVKHFYRSQQAIGVEVLGAPEQFANINTLQDLS